MATSGRNRPASKTSDRPLKAEITWPGIEATCESGGGPPDHTRPDNGPELTANGMRSLFSRIGVQALFIDLGRTWKDGYNESFTVKLRDALLNRENILHAK